MFFVFFLFSLFYHLLPSMFFVFFQMKLTSCWQSISFLVIFFFFLPGSFSLYHSQACVIIDSFHYFSLFSIFLHSHIVVCFFPLLVSYILNFDSYNFFNLFSCFYIVPIVLLLFHRQFILVLLNGIQYFI